MNRQGEILVNGKVVYPYIEKDYVQFENGSTIDEILENNLVFPTVVHNETSFKVGVGDIDVSSSIVDAPVVKMVIKGQTYQNILPEPTLRNEMQGKSMQRLNEGYDSIETVDGVSKSAILKGQTLVNLASPHEEREVEFTYRWQTYNVINDKSVGGLNEGELIYMSMEINIHEINIDTLGFKIMSSRDTGGYALIVKSFDELKAMPKNEWIKVSVIRTVKSEHSLNQYSLQCGIMGEHPTESGEQVARVSFRKPMWINLTKMLGLGKEPSLEECDNIPYFEGMQSVKMPVLQTYDGNIMRLSPPQHTTNNVTIEKINDVEFLFNQGSRQGMGGWKWNIPNGEAFTLSFDYEKVSGCENQCQISVACAGGIADKTDLSEQFGQFEKTFYVRRTTPTVVEFKPVGELTSTKSVLKISNLKWYIGNKVYSDKSNILTVNEEVELRGIGDVRDELNLLTGEIKERVIEVVLDGSEDWGRSADFSDLTNTVHFQIQSDTVGIEWASPLISDKFINQWVWAIDLEGINCAANGNLAISINRDRLSGLEVADFKKWLSQNNVTVVGKATESNKTVDLSILDQNGDTQENLHSFANGHLQVSSEAENSLLPSVQYEIPTKNSYHMDLMKTNTLYTMKAKSVSGTFTIDDTSYNVNANGTFTSPSSMTNKLLVMSNKTNEEVMILEGDVVSKAIPYFKGIKSAFEDESKIEVLSTGKNLFDKHTVLFSHSTDANGTVISSPQYAVSELISVRPNTVYTVKHFVVVVMYDKDKKYISQLNADYEQRTFTTPATCAYVRIRNWGLLDSVELQKQMIEKVVLQEGDTIVSYEPYKSNTTKIPLLSPLRSLSNEVYDEVILERKSNKAKIVQRVEVVNEMLNQLEPPIISKVDLEGFPYIHKDGHITLNSEIAPTTEVTYSINQHQQISVSNEDIVRHEKELTYLQKLMAQYVQVDYESVLLSLKA